MEDQVAKLIEIMQGMSPEGARIWADLVARKSLDALLSIFIVPLIPAFLWLATKFCYQKTEKANIYDDGWEIGATIFAVFATLTTVIAIVIIGDCIVTLNHPEATVAKDILELLKTR